MKKTAKAKAIIKLLKQGYSPKEITQRMDASYNYAWTLQKKLAAEKAAAKAAKTTILSVDSGISFTPEEVGISEEVFMEAAHQASQGKDKIQPKPEPEVSGVGKVLDTRAEQYGSFMQSSDTAIRIKGIMHNAIARNEVHLFPDQLQALDMIATKISRIVHGNPNHLDSWTDIAGYATLVADRLQGKIR
jgi:hypothetical protein